MVSFSKLVLSLLIYYIFLFIPCHLWLNFSGISYKIFCLNPAIKRSSVVQWHYWFFRRGSRNIIGEQRSSIYKELTNTLSSLSVSKVYCCDKKKTLVWISGAMIWIWRHYKIKFHFHLLENFIIAIQWFMYNPYLSNIIGNYLKVINHLQVCHSWF